MFPIKHLILTEIEILAQKSKGFEAVDHNATKGGLRENLLINFFKKLIPEGLDITSGIICDAKGKSSNQTDFIVYDKSTLPRILLDKEISIIPIETVYIIAEIKTTLRTSDLEQIKTARENFNKLELAAKHIPNNPEFKVPSVIIAYETNIAEKTLIEWMEKMNDIVSICIIGKFILSKEDTIKKYEKGAINPNYFETLVFYNQLYNYLKQTLETREINPIWDAYIMGV
ncbi:DUF6602 domain-containing protein [Flavobacterium maritimum]|uniref:DUF6602 domain-containing protein n=1 Tax=Flavobacterium maritimum TaxID=3149042 RepID=UPI0032B43151